VIGQLADGGPGTPTSRPDWMPADGTATEHDRPNGAPGSTRPRVVLLIRDLNIGGAQRQLIELASGMQRAGWPISVLVFYGGGGLEADLRARGVAVTVLDKRGRWDTFGFWYRLLRTLRKRRPAILHSYLGAENIVGATMKPFLPRTRLVWGVRSSNMDFRQYGRLPWLLSKVQRRLSRFADLVICNSTAGKDFNAARGFPERRMVVIPNGIDSDRFRPDGQARVELRREWGVGDDEVLVGLVARLDPKKDHAAFLRAAATVARDGGSVRFVCVGDGPEPYRAALARIASDLGLDRHLIWAGARLDMPRVYPALDLLVSSSSWGEGFPNVVAEAMASGVPCVVTDAGDSRLVVGETGWICRAQDDDDLVRVLRSAIAQGSALATKGERARERIVGQFSIERLVLTTSERFVELLDGSR
jgi:glycosyltransferase involved in cell wall biosynthesis